MQQPGHKIRLVGRHPERGARHEIHQHAARVFILDHVRYLVLIQGMADGFGFQAR